MPGHSAMPVPSQTQFDGALAQQAAVTIDVTPQARLARLRAPKIDTPSDWRVPRTARISSRPRHLREAAWANRGDFGGRVARWNGRLTAKLEVVPPRTLPWGCRQRPGLDLGPGRVKGRDSPLEGPW